MERMRDVFVIDRAFDNSRTGSSGDRRGPRHFAQALRKKGILVQTIFATDVAHAVSRTIYNFQKNAPRERKIHVLRFYGHGNVGVQVVGGNVSAGDPSKVLEVDGSGLVRHRQMLLLLRELFDRNASRVELHGCLVGKGHAGKELLLGLADIFLVPVLASGASQLSTSAGAASFFEGNVYAALPGRKNLFKQKIRDYSLE